MNEENKNFTKPMLRDNALEEKIIVVTGEGQV